MGVDDRVRAARGADVTDGLWVCGSSNVNANGAGGAQFSIPVHGIKAKGTAPGSAANGTATMNVTPGDEPKTTMLVWAANVSMTGLIASVGQRLIEGTANKLVKQSFDCIRTKLEA